MEVSSNLSGLSLTAAMQQELDQRKIDRADMWARQTQMHSSMIQAATSMAMHQDQEIKLNGFKKDYIKIRTDNIVLDHHSAIALVKMIHSEADTLTFEDIQ